MLLEVEPPVYDTDKAVVMLARGKIWQYASTSRHDVIFHIAWNYATLNSDDLGSGCPLRPPGFVGPSGVDVEEA
jgi:hypothetical protein